MLNAMIVLHLTVGHLRCWEPAPPQAWDALAARPLPPHPRLRLNDTQLAALNRTIARDETAASYYEGLLEEGNAMLAQPPANCTAGADPLAAARAVLRLEYALGLLYRLSGDARFAHRAAAELFHVTTNCTTWDPFGLVLAEMTHAVGIGFDWLYHYLSAAQRDAIVDGVARLGFDEALAQYESNVFWTNCTFNWGVVTNGGLTVAGLAFLDEARARANVSAVLAKAAVGMQCPFASFAPHGGWHEGAMYWQYVAEYAQAVTEALSGVYGGDDYGLSAAPGFNETVLFRLHANAPSQTPYNFGDASLDISGDAAGYFMGYAALPTSSPRLRALSAYEARRLAKLFGGAGGASPAAYDCSRIDCARLLLGYSSAGARADLAAEPTAKVFRMSAFGWDGRDAVGFMRSAWSAEASGANGTEAWLAFKAANGVPNHNDLDGGSFAYEVGGERWAVDLGADTYGLPDYFTQSVAHRYGFYRKSTAGHNTLTFNNDNDDNSNRGASDQDPSLDGITEISLFKVEHGAGARGKGVAAASPAYAIVDLTAAYAKQGASRVQRGFAFTARYETLLIVDEFEFERAAQAAAVTNVTWAMHTLAEIEVAERARGAASPAVGGAAARLSMGSAQLHVRVVEPSALHDIGAVLRATSVKLLPPQNPSEGLRKLVLHVPLSSSERTTRRIVVALSTNATALAALTRPLGEWGQSGPFASDAESL